MQAWAGLAPGRNELTLRGQAQDIYYFPASGRAHGEIFFAPGDGGWRGFAISIAKTVSGWGYDVYGLDTRRYLNAYTDHGGLTEAQVSSDFAELARSLGASSSHKFTLLGWSEGAGLSLLAAAAEPKQSIFNGLVTLGLPEKSFLAWRWRDAVTYVTKQFPNEPAFFSMGYMSKVSPLPLFMIESSNDEFVPLDTAQRLFQAAREPKRFCVVPAWDHHFAGNQDGFFAVLQEAMQWIPLQSR
jgi:fermentation-respiration switch protein FrsA (DUF1100 family)